MVAEELTKAQARTEIYENESKINQSRKSKPSTLDDVHTNQEISTTENLEETKQRKCRMRSERECLRPSRNQSHHIWQLYQMLIQKRI